MEILGVQVPQPPDSTALDFAPSGAMRKVHGDNFPVPPSLQGPKCDGITAPLRYKVAPLLTLYLLYNNYAPSRRGQKFAFGD